MTSLSPLQIYQKPLKFASYKGQIGQAPHTMPFNVYFSDVDPYGVVWHGSFLKYLEKARVELFQSRGIHMYGPSNLNGLIYCVKQQEQIFHTPARYGDKLVVETNVDASDSRKFVFNQTVKNMTLNRDVMTATTTTLLVDQHFNRVTPIPQDILNKLN